MKINDVSGVPGVYGPQSPRKVGVKKADAAVLTDKVELSPEAKEAMALRSKVESAPEVRQEKVEGLRKAIADGTYSPDSGEVARKMIQSKVFDGLM